MINKEANTERILKLLRQLVEIESPSHDKAAVDRIGAVIAGECQQMGARVTIHPREKSGDIIEGVFDPGMGDSQPILLLSHMDTVFPLGTLAHMPYREQGDKVFGPGTADMKGGIVVALNAIASLLNNASLRRPVTALFTADEETGSDDSRDIIIERARKSSLVLVLEPGMPDGSVKTWRKGVGEYKLLVHGRAAHAGADHAMGRNAIEEIAHQVLAIQGLTDYERETTLNVGVIRGGIASNVVPSEASLEVDLRVMQPGEGERIHAALNGLKPVLQGTRLEVTGGLNRPPMPFNELMNATFEKVKEFAGRAGIELRAGGTGGASDANFISPLGIPVLDGLGPVGFEAHSEREHILLESLPQRILLLTAIIEHW
jgi:glutamate carboxypeptidase